MRQKTFAYIVVGLFSVLTVYLGLKIDEVVAIISTGTFAGTMLYFLTDFKNWIIILSFVTWGKSAFGTSNIKAFFGSILITIAADIVSVPRLPPVLVDFGYLKASFDWIAINKMMLLLNFTYEFAWFTFYYILPILLMVLGFYILGVRLFVKEVRG